MSRETTVLTRRLRASVAHQFRSGGLQIAPLLLRLDIADVLRRRQRHCGAYRILNGLQSRSIELLREIILLQERGRLNLMYTLLTRA